MGIWDKWFPSRVEALLQQQIADERQRNINDTSRLERDYEERVKFLHDRYEDEVKYLRERVNTVEQEQERLTLFLHPNLNRITTRSESAAFDEENKNREPEPPALTRLQRMAKLVQEEDMQRRAAARQSFDAQKQKEADQKEAQPQTAA